MPVLNLLLRPLSSSKTVGHIYSLVFMLLFFAASVFMAVIYKPAIPAFATAILLLCILFYKAKLSDLLIKLPVIYHIIALLALVYTARSFYGSVGGSRLYMLAACAACGVVAFSLVETASAVLLSFLSDGAHPKNFPMALAAVFPLLFTTIVYVPSETYFVNSRSLLFVFEDFAPYIIVKATVLILIISVAACALCDKAFRGLSAAAVGLTLCVYCQYIFMNRSLSVFIGEPVDWDSMTSQKIINTVIWVLLFLLPIAFLLISGRVKAIKGSAIARNAHVFAGLLLGGIQLLSLIIMIFTTDINLSGHERYMLSGEEQFVVSGNKNVITFIIDEADRHFFDDIYEQEPERFDFLKDFTYYNNACMMYDATYISIPQMLSGATEPPEYELSAWVDESWTSEPCTSFYSRLHEANYTVNVFGSFSYDYTPYAKCFDNCEFQRENSVNVKYEDWASNLNALAAYRYMPMILKPSFYDKVDGLGSSVVYSNACIMKNKEYLAALKLKKSDSDENYFIVEHLDGTHGEAGGTIPERVRDSLEILREYTDQLKEMGLYDSSVIIVTGDHGVHCAKDNVPIWYIKTANEHHDEMQISSAPIHHIDYLATCIAAAGLERDGDEALFGRPIFDIPEDEQRERLVFQRFGFEYVGEIDFKRCLDEEHKGAAYGYYFTGDREDLAERENAGPPDILLELSDTY
ncbi:MAG: hypothetical protein IJ746_06995 [Ruminococcus sp.]|nr:hypothetical protein [Ruminococcus sp.]